MTWQRRISLGRTPPCWPAPSAKQSRPRRSFCSARPTSTIHSNNVRNMTKMSREMDTTLFVKNGPCMASLGLGGEGYLSFSIATPTGEGVTTPLTFTRERRCSLIDDLYILGKPRREPAPTFPGVGEAAAVEER